MAGEAKKKSGLKTFKAGESLFKENENAESLYIIQKGQVRLFRPKGRGYVDLAVLRTGEVIGEMAYFDQEASRRSCSAEAIVSTEVIEISFDAFEKTMGGLNPWFKTIINTLAGRLRKTNEKVKSLESNSVSVGGKGTVGNYKFFNNSDIVRFLAIIYLTLKTHGKLTDGELSIDANTLKLYMLQIFNFIEAKYEEFIHLLSNEKFLTLSVSDDNSKKTISTKDILIFKELFLFFNQQRNLADDAKILVSPRCEKFLQKILVQARTNGLKCDEAGMVSIDIGEIMDFFQAKKINISEEDLRDAVKQGFVEEVEVNEETGLTSQVNLTKLEKTYPAIKLTNAINALNEAKDAKGYS